MSFCGTNDGMTPTCLVDTANSEPKGSALDTGAVHVVTNQEDKLKMFDEQLKKKTLEDLH